MSVSINGSGSITGVSTLTSAVEVTNISVGAGGTVITTTVAGDVGIGTDSIAQSSRPIRLDVRGETTFGEGITKEDANWGTDPYQRVYTFSGQRGGATNSPADGVVFLANPNESPSNTRIGGIVCGSATSTGGNSGLKASIECYTNTNIALPHNTGGYLRFITKPENGSLSVGIVISYRGEVTTPIQPSFLAYRNSAFSKSIGWHNIGQNILTESYDMHNDYSTSTNGRFVAPVAGRYMFYSGGWSAANSNGSRYGMGITINGSTVANYITGGNYSLVDSPLVPLQVVVNLAANDYVDLWAFSSVATTWGGGTHWIYWGGYLLG